MKILLALVYLAILVGGFFMWDVFIDWRVDGRGC
jgi:hypothetical protein